ncbi:condensation domain-containing protein [Rhodovulum sulfidophilum]|nr:condensation domain-containing protein [Rhodovulum sulfidophilum]
MTTHGPEQALPSRPSRPGEGRAWLAQQQSEGGLAARIAQVSLPDHLEPGAVAVALADALAGRAELTRLYRFDDASGLLVGPGRGRPDLRLRWAASAEGIGPVIDSCAAAPWDLSRQPPLRVVLVLAPGAARLALIRHPVADDLPDSATLLAELIPGAPPALAGETGTGDDITRLILAEFRSALEAPQMTADCDFFDMGGHSLTATRIIGRLAATHGIELRLNDLFLHPTAAALAPLARRTGTGLAPAPDRSAASADQAPLSLAQASLWKIYEALGFGPIFNIPFVLRFLDPVDETVFATAFRDVMERHPALRSRFADSPGGVLQEAVPMAELDRMGWFMPSGDVEDPAPVLAAEAAHDFDLARELPVRLRFIRTGEGQLLSFLFHHVVLDEWSVNLMMDELARSYAARAAGRPPLWAAPAAPFHAFARRQAAGGPDPRALSYWLDALRDAPPPRPIRRPDAPPLPQNPDAANDAGGAWCEIALEPHVSDGLYALSKACSASLFNTVYAAISVALQRLAGLDALTVGTSASGRTDPDYFDTIGYFTTVTAHCLRAPGHLTPRALIGTVRDMINGSLPHCEIPIDLVEERLSDGTAAPGAHMFEVFIQIHARNALNGALEGPEGPVRFRQVDPDKTDSVLGLQFEVVEDVIGGKRGLRMMMSYRHAHYSADDVAELVAAVTRSCTAFAREGAADRPLDALLS